MLRRAPAVPPTLYKRCVHLVRGVPDNGSECQECVCTDGPTVGPQVEKAGELRNLLAVRFPHTFKETL